MASCLKNKRSPDYLNQFLISLDQEEDLVNQFGQLSEDLTSKNYHEASKLSNYIKNSFSNILSSDETRVKLSSTNYKSDYINANWIFNRYIATQHPSQNTVSDFWRMILEKKVSMIVNLNGNVNYIPHDQSIFDHLEVKVINISTLNHYHLRTIQILDHNLKIHSVYHITFNNWPDFDIPDINAFYDLLKMFDLLTDYQKQDSPIVVHCKAGVGRTGTFILIHKMMHFIKKGEEIPNIIELVKQMRSSRTSMIQGKKQFRFILQIIKGLLIKLINKNKRSKLVLSYDQENKYHKEDYSNVRQLSLSEE
jgi:protein tyrosine phosphatase